MQDWITLDSLYVVSDLHLGGEVGFQIFGSTDELAWLIRHVAGLKDSGGVHALLVNGDFIDFLAEKPSLAFDPDGATTKLDGIVSRFRPVFDALQALLKTPKRQLIVNLGNHDLELGLPWVRAHLAALLTQGDEAAAARLVFVTDGTGVRCRVGSAKVVCLHGNEVDSWNVTDYERLRRIGRDRQLGLPTEAWAPNAGSRMVVEVMNEIKRDYPFVDLFKPETSGVLPILAALDTNMYGKLGDLADIASRRATDATRMSTGFLDAETARAAGSRQPVLALGAPMAGSGDDLLDEVESAWEKGLTPMSMVRGVQADQLGIASALYNAIRRRPKHVVMREALEHLDKDRSFDPSAEDETFTDLDEQVGGDVDVLIAGHTHLERSLSRKHGAGHYFNSGTWARLIRLDPEVRQDAAQFENVFKVLAGGSMATLDQTEVTVGGARRALVFRRNSVVTVQRGGAGTGTKAMLQRVLPQQGAQAPQLKPVAEAAVWQGS